jgi:hypothetical protein
MHDEYNFIEVFTKIHTIGCYPTIYYECKYDAQGEKKHAIIIHWINGLAFNVFEDTLRKEIDKGIVKAQSIIDEISETEANNIISDFKRGVTQCRSKILSYNTLNSVYPYFSNASFDDDLGNKAYEEMKKDPSHLNSFSDISALINTTDLKINDRLLLHMHTVHFARVFLNVLDYLNEKIDDIKLSLKLIRMPSKEGQGKYELMLNKNHSSKELTYLFNLLRRIRFFEIKDGDYEKVYRLIGDLYKSQRGSSANKAKTVKNNWTNSEGHTIDESFLKNFKEKVLKELTVLVQEDIVRGYDPKRMSKLNKAE